MKRSQLRSLGIFLQFFVHLAKIIIAITIEMERYNWDEKIVGAWNFLKICPNKSFDAALCQVADSCNAINRAR